MCVCSCIPRPNVIGLLLNYYILGGRARVFSPTTGSGTMYTRRLLRRDSGFSVGGVGAKFRSASTRPANQPCARFSAAHRRHRRQQFFADTSPTLSASYISSPHRLQQLSLVFINSLSHRGLSVIYHIIRPFADSAI